MTIAGRLRHVVELRDRDGASQGTVRAHIRGTTANEAEIAGLDTGTVGLSIRMRTWRGGPVPRAGWTAIHGGRELAVKGSFDPTGAGRDLVMIALEST